MKSLIIPLGVAALLFAPTVRAHALQPLEVFLDASRDHDLDSREARATVHALRSQVDEATGRLLPSLAITGSYTRNQYEVAPELPNGMGGTTAVPITPFDQLDARITLTVPLVDIAAWTRRDVAEASVSAASEREASTGLNLQFLVAQAYYQYVGAHALVLSAQRSLAAQQENLQFVTRRHDAGLATELDVHRATAAVAQSQQSIADAQLQEALARRALVTLTGVQPEGEPPVLEGELDPEPPVETWLTETSELPSVRAARADERVASAQSDATWQALLPTVSATASERFTNATGFNSATAASWALGISAQWSLDYTRIAALETQVAQRELADVRADRAQQQAEDAVRDAHSRVLAGIERSRAARAQVIASTSAVEFARARFQAGTATQLDLLQAERDAFVAEANRISADAELALARVRLRVAAGHALGERSQP